MDVDRPMRIGELSRRAGVSTQAIRYYEQIGLLDEPQRSQSDYRLYTAADVERLGFIKKAKLFDLSLAEIRELIDLRVEGIRPCERLMDLVKQRISELDRRIEDMVAFRADLACRYERASLADKQQLDGRICGIIEAPPSPCPAAGSGPIGPGASGS